MARTGEGQGEWSLKLTPEEERAHRRRVDAASMTDVKPATNEERWTLEKCDGCAVDSGLVVVHKGDCPNRPPNLIARIEQEQAIVKTAQAMILEHQATIEAAREHFAGCDMCRDCFAESDPEGYAALAEMGGER